MSLNFRGLAAIIPTLDVKTARRSVVLGWPKDSFGYFCNILWKNLNELFDQLSVNLRRPHRPRHSQINALPEFRVA